MVTGQGYGLGTGGCKGLCPVANRAQLDYTFSLSVSIKDQSLHKASWASHRFIIPSTYLGMAQGRLVALLSWIQLFSDRLIGGGDGGGPCTALSSGLRSGGLEYKFGREPGPHDRRVMGWSCLCLGYKRGVCFRGTQLGALIRESPGNPVQLVYGLAPQ